MSHKQDKVPTKNPCDLSPGELPWNISSREELSNQNSDWRSTPVARQDHQLVQRRQRQPQEPKASSSTGGKEVLASQDLLRLAAATAG